jgi:hypothetical protein
MKKLVVIILSIFVFSPVAIFGQNHCPEPRHGKSAKPEFLTKNQELDRVIGGRAYISREIKDSKGGKVSQHRKIYFTDKDGKLNKTYDVFPKSSTRDVSAVVKGSQKYLTVTRAYYEGKKYMHDTMILDLAGNVMCSFGKTSGVECVAFDDKSGQIYDFHAFDGLVRKYSMLGKPLGDKYYSDQNKISLKNINMINEEGPAIKISSLNSKSQRYLALTRRTSEIKSFHGEMYLFDSSDGKIIFSKKITEAGPVILFPLFVMEEESRVVFYQSGPGKVKYIGLDFSGKVKWEVNGNEYYIDPASTDDRFLSCKKLLSKTIQPFVSSETYTIDVIDGNLEKRKTGN